MYGAFSYLKSSLKLISYNSYLMFSDSGVYSYEGINALLTQLIFFSVQDWKHIHLFGSSFYFICFMLHFKEY